MHHINELWRVIQLNNCVRTSKSDWLYYQLPQIVFIGHLHSDWTAIPVAACTKTVRVWYPTFRQYAKVGLRPTRMKLQCARASVLYLVEFMCAFAGPVNKYLYLYCLVQIKATTIYYICFCRLGFSESTNAVKTEARTLDPVSVLFCHAVCLKYLFLPTPTPKRILHSSVN